MILGLIFDRFLVAFGVEIKLKSIKSPSKSASKIRCDLGSIFDGSWIGFWDGFGAQVGATLGLKSNKKRCRKTHNNKMAKIDANFGQKIANSKSSSEKDLKKRVGWVQWGV